MNHMHMIKFRFMSMISRYMTMHVSEIIWPLLNQNLVELDSTVNQKFIMNVIFEN